VVLLEDTFVLRVKKQRGWAGCSQLLLDAAVQATLGNVELAARTNAGMLPTFCVETLQAPSNTVEHLAISQQQLSDLLSCRWPPMLMRDALVGVGGAQQLYIHTFASLSLFASDSQCC
jgi:hypothetical protein